MRQAEQQFFVDHPFGFVGYPFGLEFYPFMVRFADSWITFLVLLRQEPGVVVVPRLSQVVEVAIVTLAAVVSRRPRVGGSRR